MSCLRSSAWSRESRRNPTSCCRLSVVGCLSIPPRMALAEPGAQGDSSPITDNRQLTTPPLTTPSRNKQERLTYPVHAVDIGSEWLVEAGGCDEDALRDVAKLGALFASVIGELGLNPLHAPSWHVFPGEAGVTGFV